MMLLRSMFRAREALQAQRAAGDEPRPLLDHLEELRRTLLRMLGVLLAAMLLCFFLTPQIMHFLSRPVEQIRLQQEREALPEGMPLHDWLAAKRLAEVLPALSPEARDALLARQSARVREAARCVALLRAAALLPEAEQTDYLRDVLAQPQQGDELTLALSLHASGALLRPAQQDEQIRLMGAFQPAEAFMLSVNLAFFAGLILSFPVQLRLLLGFIIPGLKPNERRLLYRCVAWGCLLFIAGCAFAYLAVLPRVLGFFYNYGAQMGIQNDWRIGYYLSFAAKLVLTFGAIFELPVLVLPLIKLNILTYDLMKRTRATAFVACFAAALLLAPSPDPGTMFLMALPMYLLYELCVLFARRQKRRRQRAAA